MAAPAGGGDKVLERDDVLTRAGSCVAVCLLKRPKTLVAGIAAAAGQLSLTLGPTLLIQGGQSVYFGCLLWRTRQRQRQRVAAEMQEDCGLNRDMECMSLKAR
jgi:hypothetical protein